MPELWWEFDLRYIANFLENQSINQSILFFNKAQATNSYFKDHRGQEQLSGRPTTGVGGYSDGISAFVVASCSKC